MKKVFCVMLSMVLLVGCFLIYPEGLYMSDPATSESETLYIFLLNTIFGIKHMMVDGLM